MKDVRALLEKKDLEVTFSKIDALTTRCYKVQIRQWSADNKSHWNFCGVDETLEEAWKGAVIELSRAVCEGRLQ